MKNVLYNLYSRIHRQQSISLLSNQICNDSLDVRFKININQLSAMCSVYSNEI